MKNVWLNVGNVEYFNTLVRSCLNYIGTEANVDEIVEFCRRKPFLGDDPRKEFAHYMTIILGYLRRMR